MRINPKAQYIMYPFQCEYLHTITNLCGLVWFPFARTDTNTRLLPSLDYLAKLSKYINTSIWVLFTFLLQLFWKRRSFTHVGPVMYLVICNIIWSCFLNLIFSPKTWLYFSFYIPEKLAVRSSTFVLFKRLSLLYLEHYVWDGCKRLPNDELT